MAAGAALIRWGYGFGSSVFELSVFELSGSSGSELLGAWDSPVSGVFGGGTGRLVPVVLDVVRVPVGDFVTVVVVVVPSGFCLTVVVTVVLRLISSSFFFRSAAMS